jgi:hypothetical protein
MLHMDMLIEDRGADEVISALRASSKRKENEGHSSDRIESAEDI